jgi:hypothetical protein
MVLLIIYYKIKNFNAMKIAILFTAYMCVVCFVIVPTELNNVVDYKDHYVVQVIRDNKVDTMYVSPQMYETMQVLADHGLLYTKENMVSYTKPVNLKEQTIIHSAILKESYTVIDAYWTIAFQLAVSIGLFFIFYHLLTSHFNGKDSYYIEGMED